MKNKQFNIFVFADQGRPHLFENAHICSMLPISLMLIRFGG